jgi:preprotein translocase SecE subunit
MTVVILFKKSKNFVQNVVNTQFTKLVNKGGHVMGLKKFTGEVIKEGKRVRWPKRDVLIPSIVVVVVIAVLFALVLMLEDQAGARLIEILTSAFKNN